VHVLRTLQVWALGMALGLDVALVWYFAAVPIIVLVMLLPISPSGVGVGNAAFVYLFEFAEVAHGPAFALSVLFMLLSVIGNLPGGVLWAFGSKDAQREG
jgi:uncharacterized protein (TIRG00374 family)